MSEQDSDSDMQDPSSDSKRGLGVQTATTSTSSSCQQHYKMAPEFSEFSESEEPHCLSPSLLQTKSSCGNTEGIQGTEIIAGARGAKSLNGAERKVATPVVSASR